MIGSEPLFPNIGVTRVERCLPLYDPDWDRVPPRFLKDARTGGEPMLSTVVRVAVCGDRLLVWYRCTARAIRASFTQYKDKVWLEDAVEVFFQPPGDAFLYEFQQSPTGVVRDLRVGNPGTPGEYYDDSWCSPDLYCETTQHYIAGRVVSWDALFQITGPSVAWNGTRLGLFRIERDPEEWTSVQVFAGGSANFHDSRFLAAMYVSGDDLKGRDGTD